jgi:hypothetical protein
MNNTRTSLLAAATTVFALLSTSVFAHSDEYLDTLKAPNGGQLRMAGIYHYELVVVKDSKEAKDNPVVVHVADHAGVKIPTTGAKGAATILTGKSKVTVPLVPDGDNRMKGVGNYASTPDMKAIVSITLAGKAAEQARFTPLSMAKGAHTMH